ncbi:solute carrier family 2, facilitated glucose transporter member 12 isoform X1 [Mauremys reevesii]|uniref:solute carrier family 2, facilitated glucose transporter member 12 isoform X1 n=1 Tax=Mauremys reevesii TaxID=260615 RepID=UPI00193F8303|nr:solute carrier family 2, facilitated glucose transporter member 12 isoform X1 [Mauremys reevesii]XP_039384371.1 solute carrier family 2, facilitated glucose transporter member 12 isoform X1 [Mauremys reevesii]XP_039384372.1 solute carrier family 2, facilitated glucose transporter member 12 isoform X1 [Mauremys reevesii]XP_039384373.1 solute carrier family 2, facilitated glucose transporter member 12 isoform X1 [Mauremys reevesii]XP_039384374.1 solute carrier family 2, facilitated glucose tra
MVPVQNVEDLNQQCRKMRTGESDDNRGDSSSNANLHKLPSQTGCGTFTFLSSAIAAISGFLMGYELGLISGALLQLSSILALSCKQQEIVVSSLLIGALLASLTGGFLIDRFGRRIAIIIASCLLVLGSLILILSTSYGILIVGRIAIGISISLSSIATCVYIAEIAPQHRRGLLVSLNELMIVIGILFAYIANYVFARVSHGWKYMFGLVIPIGALQAIAMYFLPPSPRFLVMKGSDEAASKVLGRLRATSNTAEELTVIKSSLKDEHQYSFLDLFRSKDNMRARMLIGLTLVFFVQTTGQPNILFYASTVLKSVGFQSNEAASLASTGVGVVKVVSTIPATVFVDQVGSKTFLCIGSSIMAVSLVTMGLVNLNIHMNFTNICRNQYLEDSIFHEPGNVSASNESLKEQFAGMPSQGRTSVTTVRKSEISKAEEQNSTALAGGRTSAASQTASHIVIDTVEVPAALKWLSLASLLVYVAAFSIGLGPMTWLVLSEIFPGGIRGRAMALTSSMNWGINLLISLTFLTVTDLIGLPWVCFIYSIMSLASLAFIIVFIPETKGCSLEQISMELAKQKYTKSSICWMGQRREKLVPIELPKRDHHEPFY